MKKYTQEEFIEEVNKAYDILWKLYKSGNWDFEKEDKLVKMLNVIDDELGR